MLLYRFESKISHHKVVLNDPWANCPGHCSNAYVCHCDAIFFITLCMITGILGGEGTS